MVSVNNYVLVPIFGLISSTGLLCAHAMRPICVLMGENCCCRGRREEPLERGFIKEI